MILPPVISIFEMNPSWTWISFLGLIFEVRKFATKNYRHDSEECDQKFHFEARWCLTGMSMLILIRNDLNKRKLTRKRVNMNAFNTIQWLLLHQSVTNQVHNDTRLSRYDSHGNELSEKISHANGQWDRSHDLLCSSSIPDRPRMFSNFFHLSLSIRAMNRMLFSILLSSLFIISVSSQRYSSRNKFEARIVASFVTERSQPIHYEVAKPALAVAVREANRRFPAINFNLVVNNDSDSCFYSYAGGPVSRQFYSKGNFEG